jgi:hypothetical protein
MPSPFSRVLSARDGRSLLRASNTSATTAAPVVTNTAFHVHANRDLGISYPEFAALHDGAPMQPAPAFAPHFEVDVAPNIRLLSPRADSASQFVPQAPQYRPGIVQMHSGPRLASPPSQEPGRIAQRFGLQVSDEALAQHSGVAAFIPWSHPDLGHRYEQLLAAQEAARGVFASAKLIEQSLGSARAMRRYWGLPDDAAALASRAKLALEMAYALEANGVRGCDLARVASTGMQRGHRADRLTAIADGMTNAAVAFGIPAMPTAAIGAVSLAGGPIAGVAACAGMAALMAPVTAAFNVAVPHAIAAGRTQAAEAGNVIPPTTARVPRWGPRAERLFVDPLAYQAFLPGQALVQAGPMIAKGVVGTAAVAGAAIASACAAPLSPFVSALGGGIYSTIKEKYCSERVWTGAVTRTEQGTLSLDQSRFHELIGYLGRTPVHAAVGRRVAAGLREMVGHPIKHIREAVREQPRQVLRNAAALLTGDIAGAVTGCCVAQMAPAHARMFAGQCFQGAQQAVMLAGWGLGRQRAPVAALPTSQPSVPQPRPDQRAPSCFGEHHGPVAVNGQPLLLWPPLIAGRHPALAATARG